jgi:hypothetical protein
MSGQPHVGASPRAHTETPKRFRVKREVDLDAADRRDLLTALIDYRAGLSGKLPQEERGKGAIPLTRRISGGRSCRPDCESRP